MIVQGVELAAQAKEVKLPADAVLIETPGLPETLINGRPHLIGVDGTLYPRFVNTGTGHVAIGDAVKKPKKKAAIEESERS